MRRDDLNQPLHKRSLSQRLWERRPNALTSAYVAVLVGMIIGGTFITTLPHPFAGEPVVMVAVAPLEEIKTASVEPLLDQAEEIVAEELDSQEKILVKVEPAVEQQNYEQDAIIYVSPKTPLTKAPISNLVEVSAQGPLPRIAGGKKPSEAYARSVSKGIIHSDAPKLVIILGGMGLNEKLTARAAKDLPSDITMAFAPYGENLQAQVNKARANGHEVLLQLPLEPVGFPAANPGPKTLLADGAEAENLDALYWHMSRFTGYTGIVNYMGGRFLASAPAIKPILTEFRKRGLLFIEDGSLPLSATEDVAKSINYQVRRGQTVIDANADPESIIAALNLLEEEARSNGIAIGTGSGLDTTIRTVNDWAKAAVERGIIFVPASAAFKGRLG